MIRSPSGYAVSVRKPDGEIVVRYFPKKTLIKRFPFNIPLVRGIIAVYELLVISFSAFDYSSEILGEKKNDFSFVLALILGLFLFIALPYYLTVLTGVSRGSITFHIIDGILKIMVILSYLMIVRIFKEVRRIFSLHGAEHAVVNSYEKGVEMASTFHHRCGTNLIIIIVLVSVLIFSLFRVGLSFRFFLLPIIFSFSYEFFLILNRTGMIPNFFQYLTTMKPSEEEIRIARKALDEVLHHEMAEG